MCRFDLFSLAHFNIARFPWFRNIARLRYYGLNDLLFVVVLHVVLILRLRQAYLLIHIFCILIFVVVYIYLLNYAYAIFVFEFCCCCAFVVFISSRGFVYVLLLHYFSFNHNQHNFYYVIFMHFCSDLHIRGYTRM